MADSAEARVGAQADILTRELAALTDGSSAVEVSAMEPTVRRFVNEVDWSAADFAVAEPGEERLYRLGSPGRASPAAYLVSDGVGVISAPHEHETWAIIFGIRGQEINNFFSRGSSATRKVSLSETRVVGPGEVLSMDQAAIHATAVDGFASTFHLHVYGRPLDELSSFADRSFVSDR